MLPMKRSPLPNTHCGEDAFRPSTWAPTDARSVYALGPGEEPEVPDSLACSGDRKTFDAWARVLLPKPKRGADRRRLCTWSPNMDLVLF